MIRVIGPLLVTLAMLLALEGGLRLAGLPAGGGGGDAALRDILPMFQPSTGSDGVPRMQRHDQKSVAFRREKPADGFRVFVLGDSLAIGFPFGPEFAFSRFLQERLAAAMPGRTVEVVNCSANAIASWHAREVLDESRPLRSRRDHRVHRQRRLDHAGPEAVNPASRCCRTCASIQLAGVGEPASWQPADDGKLDVERVHSQADAFRLARERARGTQTLTAREREQILARYAENLRAIVAAGRAAGATVILSDLGPEPERFPSRARRAIGAA